MKILKKYHEVKPYIKKVADEADNHNHCFGFLPLSVYEQLSQKEGLWVLIDDDNNYIGHILFNVAWNKYKLTINQTYIIASYRKLHYASLLINELKKWAEEHSIIELHAKVASDLTVANSFYNKMGFIAVMQIKGGETTKRLINIRILYLNTPTLLNFSAHKPHDILYNQPINIYRKYIVDINILLDLISNRNYSDQAQRIIKGSLNGAYKLAITPEANVEIKRNAKTPDPLAALVINIPSLQVLSNIETTKEYQYLEQIIFKNIDISKKSATHKISDLKHLTYCIVNNCTGFITRDQDLLKKASIVHEKFGIEIISPEEFMINEEDFSSNDTTISLNNSNYDFINISEDSSILNECLDHLKITRESIQLPAFDGIVVMQDKKNYLACAFWSKVIIENRDAIAYIFANNLCNNELFDHIIEKIFRFIKSKKISSIAIFTQGLIPSIDETLKIRGFSRLTENTGMIKYSHLIVDKIITEQTWLKFKQTISKKLKLDLPEKLLNYKELTTNGILLNNREYYNFFEFETKFSPSLFVPQNRNIYIVPIRAEYAKELIGDSFDIQRSLSLSPQKPALLKTEKAYFCRPGKGHIAKGSLIMFYVSRPVKCMIGIARVTYSDTIPVDKAMDLLVRQGVLEKDKMLEISKNEQIEVFTFDNFHQFPQNIDIQFLKSLGIGKNNFITKFTISYEDFIEICIQGGIYGN